MTSYEQELFQRLVQTQEDLLSQAEKRNDLLSKHTSDYVLVEERNDLLSKHNSDYVLVEEKRTVAIERLSKAIESLFEQTTGGKK